MADLAEMLNEAAEVKPFLPTKKMADLPIGEKQLVTAFFVRNTMFGKRIVLELKDECSVFLPGRMRGLTTNEKFIASMEENVVKRLVYLEHVGQLEINGKSTKFPDIKFIVVVDAKNTGGGGDDGEKQKN